MAGERIEAEMTVSGLDAFVGINNASPVGSGANVTAGAAFISDLVDELETSLNHNVQGYPKTAAAMASAVGYGTWANGWLFDITSGNDTGAFGGATFTAVSSPLYGFEGPRGGVDLMVGSDSVADGFDAGNIHDVGAADDIIAAFALYAPNIAGNEDIWGRDNGSTGYILVREGAALALYVRDGVDTVRVEAAIDPLVPTICLLALARASSDVRIATIPFYGGAVSINAASSAAAVGSLVNATNYLIGDNGTYRAGGMRIGAHYVGSGVGAATGATANMTTAISNLQAALNASWTASLSATDGTVTIDWTGYASPVWSLALSTTLRDVLGFTADITNASSAQTGTRSARGIWIPRTTIAADSDPLQAPIGDDASSSISPTGRTYSIASSEYYRARNVRFPMVNRTRVWSSAATTPGADWETFYLDTQLAHHSWFDVRSRVKVYWDNAGVVTELGNGNVEAWTMPKCVKLDELSMSVGNWTGLFDINLGDLYTDE
jgi:hypothetical protein